MQKLFTVAVAASLCALCMTVLVPNAGWAQNYARQGAYVGAGFSYALENFGLRKTEQAVSDTLGTSVELGADGSPGFDIRGGYRFHPNFALEGDVQYFTGFDLTVDKVGGVAVPAGIDSKVGTIDTLAMTVNAKGYALTGQVQPYGLLGLGFMRANFDPNVPGDDSQDDTTFTVRFGGGFDYYATENVVFNFEISYLLPTSDYKFGAGAPGIGGDIVPIGAGVQYRF